MLKVERFVNQLMSSNCYVVYDKDTKRCVVIDPASERSEREITFIEEHQLELDYIIITHEHTDHNWGVNALREHYANSRFVCSEECNKWVKKTNRAYFLFYYDNPSYRYEITTADVLISQQNLSIQWNGLSISFVLTPGHCRGAMCVNIDNMLFTGDTIMPFKPYFNGRDSNEEDWEKSVEHIKAIYSPNTRVCPGHGDFLLLGEWNYMNNNI